MELELTAGVFLHQDNAPVHKSTVVMAAIYEGGPTSAIFS